MKQFRLPHKFRKLSPQERLETLRDMLEYSYKTTNRTLPHAHKNIADFFQSNKQTVINADMMIESALGTIPIPIGIVPNLIVDNKIFQVPLATEEPSVIAGASYAASIFARAAIHSECIKTSIAPPLQIAQIAIRNIDWDGEQKLNDKMGQIKSMLMEHLENMHKRGGGLRRITYKSIERDLFVVYITIDVCDAMGANIANTTAEYIAPKIKILTGGTIVAAIVSNYSDERIASAEITLDVKKIPAHNKTAEEVASNIECLSRWAEQDIYRATTHNKGIMNGVSGLALATGNDTRAIEAASHAMAVSYAIAMPCKSQKIQSNIKNTLHTYQPLSKWEYKKHNNTLCGYINIPALFATKGGVTGESVYAWNIALLHMNFEKKVGAHIINRVAAGLGLAQNFAALLAISTDGIQKGHMALHKRKTHDE